MTSLAIVICYIVYTIIRERERERERERSKVIISDAASDWLLTIEFKTFDDIYPDILGLFYDFNPLDGW